MLDFRVEPIEQTSFPDAHADVVIASAVLHFARDDRHFEAMLRQMWRVLKPGGVFFARLASTIGIESDVIALGDGTFRLPDGSDRFLVDAAAIEAWTERARRHADRSDQDHRRPRSAIDDHVGR